MLVATLVAEMMLAIFLAGVLIIVLVITRRHGDPSATYKLYAVRDKLIHLVVFNGIDRENPWLDALFENTNRVLLHSNLLLDRPGGWSLVAAGGHHQANHPNTRRKLQPFPTSSDECPVWIRELVPELRAALEQLARNDLVTRLLMNAQEREQRRMQRETARKLLQMMLDDVRFGCATY
jgi:hypothetical protein